jgi:lipid II:glycine glycyltransferase (peptidoglycan interpeptide bridge formation enzyme)
MRDKTRNVIRRAEETLRVATSDDAEAFANDYASNIEGEGRQNYYPPALIRRVAEAALGRGQGQIWAAHAADGTCVAAIFCVSDSVSTYYLLTTRRAAAGNGAVPLLIWNAIQHSAARGLIFDFDGVAGDGARVFFTGFGGEVKPRYTISRFTRAHRIAGRLGNPFRKHGSTYY